MVDGNKEADKLVDKIASDELVEDAEVDVEDLE